MAMAMVWDRCDGDDDDNNYESEGNIDDDDVLMGCDSLLCSCLR